MSSKLNFEQLVNLCRETHEAMQGQAIRAVDAALVIRNWLFGWYIVEYEQKGEDRAQYGAFVIKRLSEALSRQLGKGFSARSLEQARRFYLTFRSIPQTPSAESLLSDETARIAQTVSAQLFNEEEPSPPDIMQWTLVLPSVKHRFSLGWSHYVELLTLDDPAERRFYEIEAAANQWSVRELQRQIASSLYQRLALSRDKEEVRRLAVDGQLVEKAADLIKNPLVLEFLGLENRPHYSEEELESVIIDQLEIFLLELGKGFLFEARQKRFTFDNDHFRVDLVFYNRLLRCYVLIDLKRDKLTHQDLGQMQMYVNYFDRQVKLPDELPTIGIVLCHRKNDALVELTLPKEANIFASRYQLYLPSKEELKAQLQEITKELGQGGKGELTMESGK
jgi:predicted nuclease of restriction endonuclease-like (RecB) superfamily